MPWRAICPAAQELAAPLRIQTCSFAFSGPQTLALRCTVHFTRSPAQGFPIWAFSSKALAGMSSSCSAGASCLQPVCGQGGACKSPASAAFSHSSLLPSRLCWMLLAAQFCSPPPQVPHFKVAPEEFIKFQFQRFTTLNLHPSNTDISVAVAGILNFFNCTTACLICAKAECKFPQASSAPTTDPAC